MEFYFKITTEKEIAYSRWVSDFSVLPTQEFIDKLVETMKIAYTEAGYTVITLDFCTKEEYEQNKSDSVLEEIKW